MSSPYMPFLPPPGMDPLMRGVLAQGTRPEAQYRRLIQEQSRGMQPGIAPTLLSLAQLHPGGYLATQAVRGVAEPAPRNILQLAQETTALENIATGGKPLGIPKSTLESLKGTKVVGKSGRPRRVYHGTWSPFDEFQQSHFEPGLFGPGVYMTENPRIASGYSGTIPEAERVGALSGKVVRNELGHEKLFGKWQEAQEYADKLKSGKEEAKVFAYPSKDLVIADRKYSGFKIVEASDVPPDRQGRPAYRVEATSLGGPNVRPGFADIKNPFDIDKVVSRDEAEKLIKVVDRRNPEFAADLAKQGYRGRPGYSSIMLSELREAADNKKLTGEQMYTWIQRNMRHRGDYDSSVTVTHILREAGYDGITHMGGEVSGGKKHRVWIAFDPGQVKPAFGVSK